MIYLDTCIVIDAVENTDPRAAAVRARLRALSDVTAISALVVHECLVRPIRERDNELRDRFLAFFDDQQMLDLDLAAFLRAAELRAASPSLRVPDALHLAAAQIAGCTELWTNDRRLATVSRGLAVDIVGG